MKKPAKKKATSAGKRPSKAMAKPEAKAPPKRPKKASAGRLYTLKVFIISGPIHDENFIKKNPVISRTIEIRGGQTLEDLHYAIYDAFDRFDEHMYEFQFGKKPHDGPRYSLPMALEDPYSEEEEHDLTETTLDSLDLRPRKRFWYWFDFGDDWWHRIEVVSIGEAGSGKYPKVTQRVGKSPPQYPDLDDEYGDYDEEE
jgi:hypothetical protein